MAGFVLYTFMRICPDTGRVWSLDYVDTACAGPFALQLLFKGRKVRLSTNLICGLLAAACVFGL